MENLQRLARQTICCLPELVSKQLQSTVSWTWHQSSLLSLAILPLILTIAVRRIKYSDEFTRSVLRSLRLGGSIPTHVAIIMDGNRRWARKGNLETHQGHFKGGEKLTELLQWCLEAGVGIVTVYAFSIENFKRPKKEVDAIMQLAHQKFTDMLQRSDAVQKHQVKVRVLGDLSRIPPSLRTIMCRVMSDTLYNKGPTLNICFAYTSRFDIANGITRIIDICDRGLLPCTEINENTLSACLSTGFANGVDAQTPYPELLIRTSGETRLSDFLLWESSYSILSFYAVLWPDLTAWDFVQLLLDYQRRARERLQNIKQVRKNNNQLSPLANEYGWDDASSALHVRKAMRILRNESAGSTACHA